MTRRLIILLALILTLISIGPASAVTYNRIDAPEFDITNLNRIAVLPFEPGRESAFEGVMIADRLATHLAQEGYLKMIERMQVEKVMSEGEFSRQDFADTNAAANFGKLLGADAIIIGRVDTKYNETEEYDYVWKDKKVLVWKDGKQVEKTVQEQVKVPVLKKSGEVNLDTKVVEVQTGRILASKVAYNNWEERGVDNQEINALPPANAILEDCLTKCMDILIRAYTPHKVSISRDLRPKKANDEEKRAIHLAESGLYSDSVALFEQIIAKDNSKNDIRGDLAIVYEALGNFEKAEFWLNEAVRNGKSAHDLNDYRNSMLKAWYFVQKKNAVSRPIIVLNVVEGLVYIDAGSMSQVKVGDRFTVCRETKIVHPVSGEDMGSHKRDIALIEIVEIQDKMAVAKVVKALDPELSIQPMDVVIEVDSKS